MPKQAGGACSGDRCSAKRCPALEARQGTSDETKRAAWCAAALRSAMPPQKSSTMASALSCTRPPSALASLSTACSFTGADSSERLASFNSSPGSNAGLPRWGQLAQRKASPRAQLPHADFTTGASWPSSSSRRPHVQFLHALRLPAASGAHSLRIGTLSARSASLSSSSSSMYATVSCGAFAAADHASSGGACRANFSTGFLERKEKDTPCAKSGFLALAVAQAKWGFSKTPSARRASLCSGEGALSALPARLGNRTDKSFWS
mmetsp:Transcript_25858/g.56694  ORF Transcript_25858/g.56694 Transcript_25858/m.56694 type:complete len:264 (-) Transcript_25858:453-1244(-)